MEVYNKVYCGLIHKMIGWSNVIQFKSTVIFGILPGFLIDVLSPGKGNVFVHTFFFHEHDSFERRL